MDKSAPVEHLLEHRHGRRNARLAPGRKRVQLHVGRNQRGGELCVGGCACSAASDLG